MENALHEKYTIDESSKKIKQLDTDLKNFAETKDKVYEDILMTDLKI